MGRPAVPVLVGALVLALFAPLAAAPAPRAATAQDATPAVTPEAETLPFAAPGVTYEVTAAVPAPDPADGFALQLGEIAIEPSSDGVERTSDDAEALEIEEGLVVLEVIALEGEGRLVSSEGETECAGEGCDLAEFVGQEIVLGPGDSVTHAGPMTYALRPFDLGSIQTAAEATPTAIFSLLPAGSIVISHICGGRCQ